MVFYGVCLLYLRGDRCSREKMRGDEWAFEIGGQIVIRFEQ